MADLWRITDNNKKKEKSYFSGFLKRSSQLHDTNQPFVVASHLSVFILISFSVSAVKTKAAAWLHYTALQRIIYMPSLWFGTCPPFTTVCEAGVLVCGGQPFAQC